MAVEVLEKLVVGQRYVAPCTFRHPSTGSALGDRCISPPILEQNDLLARVQGIAHGLQHPSAEVALHVALLVGFAEVHQFDFRQRGTAEPFQKRHMNRPLRLHGPTRLQGRCGRSEQHGCPVQSPQHRRCIPRLVTRCRILLFVAGIVLLIDHDQAEVSERQEHRAAGPNEQTAFALFFGHAAEGGGPLPRRETAVVNLQPVSEKLAEPHDELGGQGNLRNQEQSIASFVQHLGNQMCVHLRLAAARHALEQDDAGGGQSGRHGLSCALLCLAQIGQFDRLFLSPQHPGILLEAKHQALVHQTAVQTGIHTLEAGEVPQGHAGSMGRFGQEGHHGPGL